MGKTEFQINDYMVYGGSGVCVVKDITNPQINGIDPTRLYYILTPLYANGATIFSPVDGTKIVMRRLITKPELVELISQMPDTETIWVDNEKMREAKYLEALNSYSCYEWMRIIKTLYQRMEARIHDKKPVGEIDQRYLRMAEDLLFGELAVTLDMPKESVGEYIAEQIRLAEAKAERKTASL